MATSMQDYLKRYNATTTTRGDDEIKPKPKKKKKAKGSSSRALGQRVVIVDDDGVWQKEGKLEEEDDDEGDKPTVIEDIDVKVMHRMEALKSHRPYLSVANDGSGWVTVKGDGEDSKEGRDEDIGNYEGIQKRGDNEDLSPPRKRHDSPKLSPPRRRQDTDFSPSRKKVMRNDWDGDLSPPRKRHQSPNLSPPRKSKDTDLSPLQKKVRSTIKDGDDFSPPRKRLESPDFSPPRHRKGVQLSPPLKKISSMNEDVDAGKRKRGDSRDRSIPRRRHDSADFSSPRKRRDADLSPPRKKATGRNGDADDLSSLRKAHGSPDMSPPRRRDTDLLPPWKKVSSKQDDGDDLSPSRRRHDSPDMSPPRRKKDLDLSPLRRKVGSNVDSGRSKRGERGDLSPPRRRHESPDLSPPRRKNGDLSSLRKKVTSENEDGDDRGSTRKHKMSDGSVGGLKTDKEVVEEIRRKKAIELKALGELDPSESGRGAETVYRDKRGRRLDGLEELLRQQKGEAKPAEKPLEWGKGLAQKRELEAKFAELEAEKSKPFARTRDDPELDKALRETVRWGDPMAHLVKKKMPEPVLLDLGASEEMKASGFVVPQDIPPHSWLKRGIAPTPNRYGIKPGRHWDGVDRSTGYERDMFKAKNEKHALEQEAYLWSVADM